jgi:hypothetical protein
VIVPNGKLADSILRNDSIVTTTVAVETEVWLSHESDELRALEVIGAQVESATAAIKSVTDTGTVLGITGPPTSPIERAQRQAELLQECLKVLRNTGLR